MTEKQTQDVDRSALIKAEMEHVDRADADPGKLFGLSLSGGGIRSASFSLGVVQALEEKELVDRLDYLSTVSGGGYTGSAITWLRHAATSAVQNRAKATATRDNPPDVPGGSSFAWLLERFSDFLRSRGNYLDPNRRLNVLSLVGVVLRTMVINATVYLGAAVVVLAALRQMLGAELLFGGALAAAALLAAILVVLSWYFGLLTGQVGKPTDKATNRRYHRRTNFQRWFGVVLGWAMVLLLLGTLPWVEQWLHGVVAQGLAGLAGLVGGATQAWGQFRNAKAGRSGGALTSGLVVWLSAGLAIYGMLLLADLSAVALVQHGAVALWGGLLALVVVLGVLANLNFVTPHRMYRDRLMEAFMPNPDAMLDKGSEPADMANAAPLTAMCDKRAPLHLVNTNLILVDSPNTLYRGRGGDNFVLSPVWCGGDATGWLDAKQFAGTGPGGLSLATAMAISGAAVNAHAGCGGVGPTRNALVSMLLVLFGLQLGYWVPRNGGTGRIPNFLRPGGNALFGRGFDENARFLQLSDGGHFENLALYELVRRRVKAIVVVDGGADPEYQFGDLGNAIERVYVDFGARIEFPEDALGRLVPVKGDGFPAALGISERGWIEGRIIYADGTVCSLYYVKAAVVEGLPASIYAYKAANADFPNQSTADQFFDEAQLEAYRRLGYEVARSLPGTLA